MDNYKQIRLNFNVQNDDEMVAWEHLKSLGRKSSRYVIELILSDLNGERPAIISSISSPNKELLSELDSLKARITALEESFSVNDTEQPSVKETETKKEIKSSSVLQTEDDDNDEDVVPMFPLETPRIPGDLAAYIGGL